MTETESYLRDMAALDVEKIVFSSPCGENSYKKTVIRRLKDGFQPEHFTESRLSREFSGRAAGGEVKRPVSDIL